MKKISLVVFFVMVCLQAPLCLAETIYYSIQTGVKVGEAQLSFLGPTEYKGKQTVLIIFQAVGFKFKDEERIYLDPKTYRPLYIERTYNKEKIFEEYLADAHEVKITKTVGKKTTEQIIKKKNPVDNIYGFIYRYRKEGSFKVGETLDLNLPTKDLKIQLLKQVPLKISGEDYNSFYMQSKPSKYKIWFDTSDKKIPLRISSSLGTMVMTLYEN